MNKRTLLLVIAMVASLMIATTGTMAYLQDSDADVNVMTLGNVNILQNEQERREDGTLHAFTQNKPLYPAVYADEKIAAADPATFPVANDQNWAVVEENVNVVDKFVTVTNTGKSDAYVRTIILFEGTKTSKSNPVAEADIIVVDNSNSDIFSNFESIGQITIDNVIYSGFIYTYKNALKPGETTAPSLKQVYMNKLCDNDDVAAYGDNYDILVLSQAVQAAGFDSADVALNTAFPMTVNNTQEMIAKWFGETEVGSPGDEWPSNDVPATVTNAAEFAAALASAQAGDAIVLGEGDYGFITIDSALTGVTIGGKDGANARFNIGSNAELTDVTFAGFDASFTDGSSAYVDGGLINIDAGAKVKNLTVKDVTANISGGRSCFIGCSEPTAEITIENCDVTGSKYLVYGSAPVKKLTVKNSKFTNFSSWAILLNAGDSVGMELTIDGNTFVNCTDGIAKTLGSAQPDGAATVFTNNTLTNCKGHDGSDAKWFAIMGASSTVTVSGNTLDGADWTPGVAQGLGK